MRILPAVTALPMLIILTACGAPSQGYYDANGNYIPPANATTDSQMYRAPDPAMNRPYVENRYNNEVVTTRTVVYDRPGYYDYNGYYVTMDDRTGVPRDMFPPRGMCRVWIPGRLPESQPRIESCDGIQSRVPAGAYVIYGG